MLITLDSKRQQNLSDFVVFYTSNEFCDQTPILFRQISHFVYGVHAVAATEVARN